MLLEDLLCNASASGNRNEVTRLLQKGADVNGFNQFNRTALQTSDAALILQLLQAGANPDVADPACGLTLLHDTSREGFDDSVRVLLEHGADANRVDVKGNLPLHVAAREGHLKVVQLLIGKTTDTVQYLQSI
uniref:Cyclin-dependent kinase inhibitor 2C (p18, inhibits CDK4) n=1 Tax=Takifugu rubripes TaxID=31033 RepID=H2S3X8_TAKRU